ncbi:MAG: YopX protein [Bacteroidota bacterium]|jgi:hypothetical protein
MRPLKFRVYIREHGKYVYFSLGDFDYSDRYLHQSDIPVEQFTGMYDKNSTLIYDGDIIKWGNLNYLVEWNHTACKWQGRCPYHHPYHHPITEHFRDLMNGIVIGNEIENEDLLKK